VNLKGRDHLGDPVIDETIILKWILIDCEMWLIVVTSGEIL